MGKFKMYNNYDSVEKNESHNETLQNHYKSPELIGIVDSNTRKFKETKLEMNHSSSLKSDKCHKSISKLKLSKWVPIQDEDLQSYIQESERHIRNVESARKCLERIIPKSGEISDIIKLTKTELLKFPIGTLDSPSKSLPFKDKSPAIDSFTEKIQDENIFIKGSLLSRNSLLNEIPRPKGENNFNIYKELIIHFNNVTRAVMREECSKNPPKIHQTALVKQNIEYDNAYVPLISEYECRRSAKIEKNSVYKRDAIDRNSASSLKSNSSFTFEQSTNRIYNSTIVADLCHFISQKTNRKIQLESSIRKKLNYLEKEKKKTHLELRNNDRKKMVVNEKYKRQYLDYVTSKIKKLEEKLKKPALCTVDLSPIKKSETPPIRTATITDGSISKTLCQTSASRKYKTFDINDLEIFLEAIEEWKDVSLETSNDSLNDKPTDLKYANLRNYIPWNDESIWPLVEIALEQLFIARQDRLGKTKAAFQFCLNNMSQKFLEQNNEAEITRIYNQWSVYLVAENKMLAIQNKRIIDRIRIYYTVLSVMENIFELDDEPDNLSGILNIFDKKVIRKLKLWQGGQPPNSLTLVTEIVRQQLMFKGYLSGYRQPEPRKKSRKCQWFLDTATDDIERMVIEEESNNDLHARFYDQAVEIFERSYQNLSISQR